MNCPVCKMALHDKTTSCPRCGFDDLNIVFLNAEDLNKWKESVLKPYVETWKANTFVSKLCIQNLEIERDISLEKELGIADIKYYAFTDESKDQFFIIGELFFDDSRKEYINFKCVLYDSDDDILSTKENEYYSEGLVTTRISPFADNGHPISFRFFENFEKVKSIKITPALTDEPWPAREALTHVETHSAFDNHLCSENTVNDTINIKDLKVGEKVPKSVLQFDPFLKKELTFEDFRITTRKSDVIDGMAFLDFSGEYSGRATINYLMYIMVYNYKNEMIGYSANHTIGHDFCGSNTFELSVKIPNDEFITKIIIRFDEDPIFLDKRLKY